MSASAFIIVGVGADERANGQVGVGTGCWARRGGGGGPRGGDAVIGDAVLELVLELVCGVSPGLGPSVGRAKPPRTPAVVRT